MLRTIKKIYKKHIKKIDKDTLDFVLRIIEIVIVGALLQFQSNSIMNRQLEIEKIKVRPSFNFYTDYDFDENYMIDTRYLYTTYSGNSFTDYSQDIKTILVLETKSRTIEFPFYGFWLPHIDYNKAQNGVIRKSGYKGNFKKFLSIDKGLLNKYGILVNVDTYIRIMYKDILKNEQKEYFKIHNFSDDVISISDSEFKHALDLHSRMLDDSVDIDKDNEESIYAKILR